MSVCLHGHAPSLFQGAEKVISPDDVPYYWLSAERDVESDLTTTLDLFFSVRDSYTKDPAIDRKPNDVQTLVGQKANL